MDKKSTLLIWVSIHKRAQFIRNQFKICMRRFSVALFLSSSTFIKCWGLTIRDEINENGAKLTTRMCRERPFYNLPSFNRINIKRFESWKELNNSFSFSLLFLAYATYLVNRRIFHWFPNKIKSNQIQMIKANFNFEIKYKRSCINTFKNINNWVIKRCVEQ